MKKILFLVLLIMTVTACGPTKSNILQSTLWGYGKTVRWGTPQEAMNYIAPEYLKEHPVSKLDLKRFEHVKISRYMEQGVQYSPDGLSLSQTVEISVINIHTQHERSFIDHQTWKWNEESQSWLLWSGLPDITRR